MQNYRNSYQPTLPGSVRLISGISVTVKLVLNYTCKALLKLQYTILGIPSRDEQDWLEKY